MESRNTQTVSYRSNIESISNYECDELTRQRLEFLIAAENNKMSENASNNADRQKVEISLMKNPLSGVQPFSLFGLILGIFLPAAIFGRILIDTRGMRTEDLWFLGVVALVNLISAIVGFFSGKLIGKITLEVEKYSWTKMLLLLPFIGVFWGIMAGGAGGIIILIFGAFIGAFIGGIVGSVALPSFAILHRLLKKGDSIDRKHFLPLAFGITFIICGFILGL